MALYAFIPACAEVGEAKHDAKLPIAVLTAS